ncbi:MAG: TonB-dependent receptor [Xanthomonadaceae bacterium]|nr:TonB-dependent receptor [Xanthomonadaceae bacterium]
MNKNQNPPHLPRLRHRPLLAAIALALVASGAQAQTADSPDAGSDKPKSLDQVIVTGTRVADRTVAESLSPIDVLSVEKLDTFGTSELIQSLSRTIPSFNFPNTSITDGSDHVRPAQLRGLAPDQTLVLVNGKRRHTTAIVNVNGSLGRGSSPVDLNAIPSSAIERIEVLRDGAAAQYGSDAIAGVINVVLKGARSGTGADYRYGEFDKGDGELNDISGYTSLDIGKDGYFTVAAEYRDRNPTNRSRPDPRQQFPLINGQPDPREATFDRLNHRFGDAAVEDQLLFVNSAVPLTDNVEFYTFANYSQREGNAAGFYRRALDARNVPAIHPDGFLPLILSDSDDASVFGGLRGSLDNGWNWDLSVGWGGNEFDFNVGNSVNTSLGAASPTEFFAGRLENGQTTVNLDVNRGFDVGLAYPLTVAAGVEYRRDTYQITAGEPDSFFGSGSQVFPGFRPSDATDQARHNWSGYVEFDADLTDKLSAGFAARYEDYSDFGTTLSGKFSARYAFTDTVALRGTVSNGFRAPSLSQQLFSTTATNFIGGVPFDVRTFPVDSPIAQALGAEPLDAEESTNFSIGLVVQAADNWNITLDAYHIKVRDRIVLSGNLTGTAVRNFLATQGFANVDGGRYFTNAVDTTTEGIDLVSTTDFALGNAGDLNLTVALNYNDTNLDRIAANPPTLEAVDLNLDRIDHVEIGRITKGVPKYKGIVGLDWKRERWSARLGTTYYGTYWVFDTVPAEDQKFGGEWVFDTSVSYQVNERFTLSVGADNVTDELPEEVIAANSFNGILPYSGGNTPFGFNGRFFYARASLRF